MTKNTAIDIMGEEKGGLSDRPPLAPLRGEIVFFIS